MGTRRLAGTAQGDAMNATGGPDEHPIEKTGQQARQGATPHVARNVLVWGIALVAIAFFVLWVVYYN
jgi:hypothetical protein